MARRDRTQSETMPGVRSGTPRDELLSGVDIVWKSGGGSLTKGFALRPSTVRRKATAASTAGGKATPPSAAYKR